MGIDIVKPRSSNKRTVTVINNNYMTAPQIDIKDYITNKNSADLDDSEGVEADFD